MVKNPPPVWETQVQSLGWEDPLEKGMATHFSILAWRIPGTEEPGGLQTTGHKESDTTERTCAHTHTHTHTHTVTQLDGGKAEFERTCCVFKEHPSDSSLWGQLSRLRQSFFSNLPFSPRVRPAGTPVDCKTRLEGGGMEIKGPSGSDPSCRPCSWGT